MLLGVLVYATMTGCYLMSFIKIPASIASMIFYLYPAFVTITAVLLKIDKFVLKKGVALTLAGIGMVLLLKSSFGKINFMGILYAFGAAMAYTIYIIVGNNLIESTDPIIASMFIMLGVSITYGIIGFIKKELTFYIDTNTFMFIVAIIFISTVLGMVFFWRGTKEIGPSKASIISMVEPLVTIVLSCIVFKETITICQVFGGALILLSVFILNWDFKLKETRCKSILKNILDRK